MHFRSQTYGSRRGSSYLEIQVAMVMLAIGMSGLYSMTVVQSKQASRLTETLPPSDVSVVNQASTEWARKLGVYGKITDTFVPADPVIPTTTTSVIVDELDANMVFNVGPGAADWTPWSYGAAYLSAARYHSSSGLVGSYADFRALGLPLGDYEVLITYPALGSLGDDITCEIYDQSTLLRSTKINQKTAPTDDNASGANWESLGAFTITSGEVKVRLVDGPGSQNFIIADAILVRPRRALDVVSVTKSVGGGATAVLEVVP